MMNQSSASDYWQVCPPPQNNEHQNEDKRDVSTVQRYNPHDFQARLRHRTISPVAEHESDELENINGGIAGFISKLYQALQAPDDGNKYARWTKANGKDMFVIDCIPKFTDTVLPKLFKHCKFASFVRQLNIYGFQRDTDARKYKEPKDRETCRWYHVYFRPGRKDLFHLIRRKTSVCNKRRRRSSQLVKPEALDTETIIPVGTDSEHEDYYENMQRSSSMENTGKRKQQNGTKRPMMLSTPGSQMQPSVNANLSNRKHAIVHGSNDENTMYLKQQILELKQTCQTLEKTFAAELAQAYEEIHAQKQQLNMIQSVVETLRQNAGNSPSCGNNNEVSPSTALPPYMGELNVDGSPKIVDTNTHTQLEPSMYDPNQQEQVRQQRNTMAPNALVQFQKYSQVTHEPDTPPTTSAAHQVSGIAVPQAPQGEPGNVSIGISPQRNGANHHHFGYNDFGQVPQVSDDWTVYPSPSGDPPMTKFTTLHYHHHHQAGPAQAGFPSERRSFATEYSIMQQNNLS